MLAFQFTAYTFPYMEEVPPSPGPLAHVVKRDMEQLIAISKRNE
jgi:hypothetical protein